MFLFCNTHRFQNDFQVCLEVQFSTFVKEEISYLNDWRNLKSSGPDAHY